MIVDVADDILTKYDTHDTYGTHPTKLQYRTCS